MASSSVMYQPTSATPLNLPFTNGHLLTSPPTFTKNPPTSSDDESDLSEAIDPPSSTAMPSHTTPLENSVTSAEQESNDRDLASDDALGSDDGDYDMEDSPPPAAAAAPSTSSRRSSSSQTLGKRKSGVDEDDYMLNDPELYGLRRSGRARPSRRVIESDSEEDSVSDIQTRPRKRAKRVSSKAASNQPSISPQPPSDSGSDVDDYGASRPRANGLKKPHQRRHLQPARELTPNQGEVRFSTRKSAKVSNYNEDNDDPFEDEEDVLTPNYWATAEADTTPAIDVVVGHRLRQDAGDEVQDPGRDDFEYHIKWQGKAYIHATWETNAALGSYRGIRRLENYFKKYVLDDIQIRKADSNIPPEEKEKYILDREQDAEALLEKSKVERVIGIEEDDDGDITYYVKWRGLTYDQCTWEDAQLVSQIAQKQIDRYLDRTSASHQSNKMESSIHSRGKFERMLEQPAYVKHGQLREFQMKGLNWLAYNWCNDNNVVLADEMGLGKTVQTIAFMNWLRHARQQQGPFLVVVPLSTIPAWAETFDNWAPDMNYVVYNGKADSRKIIRENELFVDGNPRKTKFHVLLTTYEYILKDDKDFSLSQIKWQFLAVDEAQRLKNRDSQLYNRLRDYKIPARLLITGTPIQNTLGELSALMDFLMPGWVQVDENMDLQSEEAGRKIEELITTIQPFMLRRTKSKVESDLPPKTEKIIRVELSDCQLEHYKNILTRNYQALNAGSGSGPKQSLLNIMMELKKASNHPFLFPNLEDRLLGDSDSRGDVLKALITSSGKMMLLDQLLTKLRKDGHRVLIFSQMVKMLDILSQYMQLRGYQYQRLDGTIASGPRRMAIDHFNAPDSKDSCFLLSTRAGGLGINLMTADTVILFDSDWNPQADLQAMARAHRIGQTKPVTVYRLVSKETVEEEVLERARNKLMLEFITIQRGVTDKDAQEKMARVGASAEEPTKYDDISRILKRRGQKMFEQSGNQKKLEELNIDAVLEDAEEHHTEQQDAITADGGEEFLKNFEYTDVKLDLEWDEIIPKDELEKIRAEEKQRKDEEFVKTLQEQEAPRKRRRDDDRDERAAKKRARHSAAAEATDDSDQQAGADPMRELSEKEVRNVIRAYLRYGSIDDRGEELVQDARLVQRDRGVLTAMLDDLRKTAVRLLKEEEDRLTNLERENGKPVTKKDRKAVLFDYKGVKRNNAETIIERPGEMRMLKEVIGQTADPLKFRVPEASKGAEKYSCDWGAREDGMLLLGVLRHGYGAWVHIRDDTDLNMHDKFFLEEHRVDRKEERKGGTNAVAKSPGAVHLVRRADYLLSVLKEKTSNGTNLAAKRAVENHHRNNKKNGMHASKQINGRPTGSASPVPTGVQKSRRPEKHHHRASVDRRVSANGDVNGHTPRSDGGHRGQGQPNGVVQKPQKSEHERNSNQGPNDGVMKVLFRDIRGSLNKVKSATKSQIPEREERAHVLRTELINIGDFIKKASRDSEVEEEYGDSVEVSFWDYASRYWPNPGTKGEQVRDMYTRIIEAQNAADNVNGNRVQTNGQVNGASA